MVAALSSLGFHIVRRRWRTGFNQPPEGSDEAVLSCHALCPTGKGQRLPRREPVTAQVPAAGLLGLLNHQCHDSNVVRDKG